MILESLLGLLSTLQHGAVVSSSYNLLARRTNEIVVRVEPSKKKKNIYINDIIRSISYFMYTLILIL